MKIFFCIVFLGNLYAGQEETELDMEQQTGSKSGKEYVKPLYCETPCLFNLYAEYIMGNAGLDETQAEIKFAGKNINNFRYVDNTTYGRKQRRTKEPLYFQACL